eukprot:12321-Hanusia_phi.AAC.1
MFGSRTMTRLNEIITVNGRCTHCSMTASGIPNKTEVISRVDNLTQEGCIADGIYLEDLRRQVANVQDTVDGRVGRLEEVVKGMSRQFDRVDTKYHHNS